MPEIVERAVRVRSVDEHNAKRDIQEAIPDDSLVSWEPMHFTKEDFENFVVEYSFTDGNFIVHFYVHPRMHNADVTALEHWWLHDFAAALDSVAQEHFRATAPRITAKYTLEKVSWFFKAQGYGFLMSPVDYLGQFFQKLDAALAPE